MAFVISEAYDALLYMVVRGIEVIDARPLERQYEGRMGGDNELAAAEARRILEKVHQFQLEFRREAVLRLVQQVEAAIRHGIHEVLEGRLAVRVFRPAVAGVFLQEFRALPCAELVERLEERVVFERGQLPRFGSIQLYARPGGASTSSRVS